MMILICHAFHLHCSHIQPEATCMIIFEYRIKVECYALTSVLYCLQWNTGARFLLVVSTTLLLCSAFASPLPVSVTPKDGDTDTVSKMTSIPTEREEFTTPKAFITKSPIIQLGEDIQDIPASTGRTTSSIATEITKSSMKSQETKTANADFQETTPFSMEYKESTATMQDKPETTSASFAPTQGSTTTPSNTSETGTASESARTGAVAQNCSGAKQDQTSIQDPDSGVPSAQNSAGTPDIFSHTQHDRSLCPWEWQWDPVAETDSKTKVYPPNLRRAVCKPCDVCEKGPYGPTGYRVEPIYHDIMIEKCHLVGVEVLDWGNCTYEKHTVSVGCVCAKIPQ